MSLVCVCACSVGAADPCVTWPYVGHRYSNALLETWLLKWRPAIGVEGLARIVKAKVEGTPVPALVLPTPVCECYPLQPAAVGSDRVVWLVPRAICRCCSCWFVVPGGLLFAARGFELCCVCYGVLPEHL